MTELRVQNMSVSRGGATLVDDVSFALVPGELVALLGPNGAGKTSLIRASLGLLPAEAGQASLDGENAAKLTPADRARIVSYLPQTRPLAWPSSVRDIVSLGRFSHGVALGQIKGADREAVSQALARCDLLSLADRATDSLSGGELARVHCARAFAAEAPLLIADEPVAALDPRHQFRIMDLIADYVRSGGGALVVLHDIQLAARYASRLLFMQKGRIIADGPPADTLTAARLRDVYGIEATIEGTRVHIGGAV